MLINVAQLLKSSIGAERKYQIDELIDIDGNDVEVRGEVVLIRADRSILAKGVFNAEIAINCSRCLVKIEHPVEVKFEEEFFPTIDVTTGVPQDMPADPGAFTIDERHTIDLEEPIRQYVLMAIPMKPLCSPDCAGLCPICGHNLNEGNCECPPQDIDPRWAKLKILLSKEQERK